MSGRPRSFAGTPDLAVGDGDVLAETLRTLRLTGSVFLNARFTEPFGVVSPKQYDAGTPLAHLRHISIFHLIAAGSCTIEIATGERRAISAGDVLLLPFADAHRFWQGDFVDMAFGPDLMRPGPAKGLWTVDHGGGGRDVSGIARPCGRFRCGIGPLRAAGAGMSCNQKCEAFPLPDWQTVHPTK